MLTIILAAAAAIAPAIDRDHNMPRPGDRLTLTELSATAVTADTLAVYDFSGAKPAEETGLRYAGIGDTALMEICPREVRLYRPDSAGLTLVEERRPGQTVTAVNPERVTPMPSRQGDTREGRFVTFGRLGTLSEIQESGRTESRVTGNRLIVTPEGDSIRDVTHLRYEKNGAMSAWLPRPPHPALADTLYAPADSIDRFLAADTVTHRRIINSWYAPGYRYPLIQQTINLIYVKGIENDRRVLTLYYPRQRQEEEITDDPDNQEIRDKNRFEGFMAANTPNADGSPHQSPSSPGGNRANGVDGNSGRTSAGIAGNGAPGSGGWCDVSPVVATDKTVASICPAESGEAIVTLTNNAGALMWSQKATAEGGTAISVECPMTDMAPGSYLITVSAPGLRRTFKIVKP